MQVDSSPDLACSRGSHGAQLNVSCRVQGFPTIKASVKGRMQDYQGERSAAALKKFALGQLSSRAVTTLNKPAQVRGSYGVHSALCLGKLVCGVPEGCAHIRRWRSF